MGRFWAAAGHLRYSESTPLSAVPRFRIEVPRQARFADEDEDTLDDTNQKGGYKNKGKKFSQGGNQNPPKGGGNFNRGKTPTAGEIGGHTTNVRSYYLPHLSYYQLPTVLIHVI